MSPALRNKTKKTVKPLFEKKFSLNSSTIDQKPFKREPGVSRETTPDNLSYKSSWMPINQPYNTDYNQPDELPNLTNIHLSQDKRFSDLANNDLSQPEGVTNPEPYTHNIQPDGLPPYHQQESLPNNDLVSCCNHDTQTLNSEEKRREKRASIKKRREIAVILGDCLEEIASEFEDEDVLDVLDIFATIYYSKSTKADRKKAKQKVRLVDGRVTN